MAGLARILKLYGSIKCKDAKGNEVVWVYDYANDKPALKTDMTHEQWKASEKAKYERGRIKSVTDDKVDYRKSF